MRTAPHIVLHKTRTPPHTPKDQRQLAGTRWSEHGRLCPPIKTVHDCFPLGEWLDRQRQLATKRSSPSPTQQALAAIDPWWNPPWPILWQRAYHHAHTHPRHPATHHWLNRQHRTWPLLHPDQQPLLNKIGITA
ncbi:helicase associated domain-containing protein [Streptomyces sp. NPDC006283]|uniref:helicase associated domain-containing protein n=1 Tax=Streptomyces sp. NPDC006283 TaxID=3156741 RepID=UPI0033BF2A1B